MGGYWVEAEGGTRPFGCCLQTFSLKPEEGDSKSWI